jgi:5-methylcytosine-specific restriction endonuclease McrA
VKSIQQKEILIVSKVQKTRGAGTLTEAQYWGKIRSGLRRAFRFWPPITNAKNEARRPVKNKGRQKWEYQCNHCKQWFKGDEVEVDHIVPCGSLKSAEDLVPFLERLTTEDGFQVLCKPCHKVKTEEEKK